MGVPTQAQATVTIDGADPVCVPVLAIPRGEINRVLVKQVDGGSDGFSVKLFDRALACDNDTSLSLSQSLTYDDEVPSDQDPALHQIGPGWSAGPGVDEVREEELQLAYRNRDPLPGNNVPVQRVYVQIKPNGSGSKTFDIYLLIFAPDFD